MLKVGVYIGVGMLALTNNWRLGSWRFGVGVVVAKRMSGFAMPSVVGDGDSDVVVQVLTTPPARDSSLCLSSTVEECFTHQCP